LGQIGDKIGVPWVFNFKPIFNGFVGWGLLPLFCGGCMVIFTSSAFATWRGLFVDIIAEGCYRVKRTKRTKK